MVSWIAKPVSAQTEAGNVRLVRGHWNENFIRVLENFPVGRHDDEVDALSGAHEMLPPRDFPGGRFAILGDPQGAAFGILKMAPRQG